MPSEPRLLPPRCPRCGYDLRGEITTWTTACPTRGVCVECGLDFDWFEVLDARFRLPSWCVEATDRSRWFPRRCAGTLLRSFAPWRFWSAVRLSHPSRFGRLVGYLAVVLALVYVLFALLVGASLVEELRRFFPLGGPGLSLATVLRVLGEGALLPFATQSPGGFIPGLGTGWLRPPLHHAVEIAAMFGGLAVLLSGGHLLAMLSFAALPVSRRRAKVRWGHLLRIWLYGVAPLLAAFAVGLLAAAAHRLGVRAGPSLATGAAYVMLLVPAGEVAWWSWATSRYLRIPHAWGVGVAVMIMGYLGTAAIAFGILVAVRGLQ